MRKSRTKDQGSGIDLALHPAPLGYAFAPRPRSEWIFPTSLSKLTGFVSYSSQPAANAFSRLFSDLSDAASPPSRRAPEVSGPSRSDRAGAFSPNRHPRRHSLRP